MSSARTLLSITIPAFLAIAGLAAADDFSWEPSEPVENETVKFKAEVGACWGIFSPAIKWEDVTGTAKLLGRDSPLQTRLPSGARKIRMTASCFGMPDTVVAHTVSVKTRSPSHLECVSGACTRVEGSGESECTTEGSACLIVAPSVSISSAIRKGGYNYEVKVTATAGTRPIGLCTLECDSADFDTSFDGMVSDSPYAGLDTYKCSFAKAGTYAVKYSCSDTKGEAGQPSTATRSVDVTENKKPIPSFTFSPASPETGQSAIFNASASRDPDGTIVSYSWDFGAGQTKTGPVQTFSFQSAGTYNVALTVRDDAGDNASVSKSVPVRAAGTNSIPVASFSYAPPQPKTSDPVAFSGRESRDDDGSIASYSWDFGDGSSGSGMEINHTYSTATEYTVRLKVRDDKGAEASAEKRVNVTQGQINVDPVADFTFSPSSPGDGEEITFDSSASQDVDGKIIEYSWKFGDGSGRVLSAASATHSYSSPGTYTAELTVTDNRGAKASRSKPIAVKRVNKQPVAVFNTTPAFPSVGQDMAFIGTDSSDPDGTVEKYVWDFGDGLTGEGRIVRHKYNSVGDFTPRLTVVDNEGRNSSASKTIRVRPVVSLSVSRKTPLQGGKMDIEATLKFPFALGIFSIKKTEYDFGDGTEKKISSGLQNLVTHTYQNTGTFNLTANLTLNDDSAIYDRISVTNQGLGNFEPVAEFTYYPEKPSVGALVTFDASSSYDPDGKIVSYIWNFDTNDQSSVGIETVLPITSFRYKSGGTKAAQLVVTDNSGRIGTRKADIGIMPISIDLKHTVSPSNPLSVDFFIEISNRSETVRETGIDFGDGSQPFSVSGKPSGSVTHAYPRPGSYTARANATFDSGLQPAEAADEVILRPQVEVGSALRIDSPRKAYDAGSQLTGKLSVIMSSIFGSGTRLAAYVDSLTVSIDRGAAALNISGTPFQIRLSEFSADIAVADINGNRTVFQKMSPKAAGGFSVTYEGMEADGAARFSIGPAGSQKTIQMERFINLSDLSRYQFRATPFEYRISGEGKTLSEEGQNQTFSYTAEVECIYGTDNKPCSGLVFPGTSNVSAKDGLKFIRPIEKAFLPADARSVVWKLANSSNPNVIIEMRQACGGQKYNGLTTDRFGWIEKRLSRNDIRIISGTTNGAVKIDPFDERSFDNTERFGKKRGGLYRNNEYQGAGNANWSAATGEVTIFNYDSTADYFVRYFPPNGPNICAYTELLSQVSSGWSGETGKFSASAKHDSPYRKSWTADELLQFFDVRCPSSSSCQKTIDNVLAEKTFDTYGTAELTSEFSRSSSILAITAQVSSLDLESPVSLSVDLAEFQNLTAPQTAGIHNLTVRLIGQVLLGEETISFSACVDRDRDGYCSDTDIDDGNAQRYPGAREMCNGLDDDGDLAVDEDFRAAGKALGAGCNNWPGSVCSGAWACGPDNLSVICRPLAGNYSAGQFKEVCSDGLDNDCDGQIDEAYEYDNATRNATIGCTYPDGHRQVCGISSTSPCRLGERIWYSGQPSDCIGAVYPADESCNGVDDNCDGSIDNVQSGACEPPGRPGCIEGETKQCGPAKIGICSPGIQKCIGGVWGQCTGAIEPKGDDICSDNLDNDCDGQTDEFCTPDISCRNKVRDKNEDGIDCGGVCQNECGPGRDIRAIEATNTAIAATGVIIIAMVGALVLLGKV